MQMNRGARYARRALAAVVTTGALFTASCDLADLDAVAVGIEAATDHLNDEDDISFGDWLRDELDDL